MLQSLDALKDYIKQDVTAALLHSIQQLQAFLCAFVRIQFKVSHSHRKKMVNMKIQHKVQFKREKTIVKTRLILNADMPSYGLRCVATFLVQNKERNESLSWFTFEKYTLWLLFMLAGRYEFNHLISNRVAFRFYSFSIISFSILSRGCITFMRKINEWEIKKEKVMTRHSVQMVPHRSQTAIISRIERTTTTQSG